MVLRSVMVMFLCVMVVTVGGGVSWAQEEPPSQGAGAQGAPPSEPGHGEAHPERESDAEAGHVDAGGLDPAAPRLAQIEAPLDPEEQRQEVAENHGDDQPAAEKGLPWAEIWAAIAALAAVAMAVISLRALVFLRETFKQTREAVIEAGLATRAAEAGAAAAASGNKIARDMGIAQTRAYVDVERLAVRNRRDVLLDIRNGGHSPARWYSVTLVARFEPFTGDLIFAPIEFDSTEAMPPTNQWTGPPAQTSVSNVLDDMLSADAIDQAFKGRGVLIVQGQVRWATMFGEVLETEFLFQSESLMDQLAHIPDGEEWRQRGIPLDRAPGEHRTVRMIEGD